MEQEEKKQEDDEKEGGMGKGEDQKPQSQVEDAQAENPQAEKELSEEEKSSKDKRVLLWVLFSILAVLVILIVVWSVSAMRGEKKDSPEKKVLNEREMIDPSTHLQTSFGESTENEPVPEEQPVENSNEPNEPAADPAPAQPGEFSRCDLDGKDYDHGEATVSKSGCEDCVCDNGGWNCNDNGACTNQPSGQSTGQPGDCDFQGATYNDGETRKADCDHICTCNKGTWDCVMQPTSKCCRHNGTLYKNGENFPAGDGCNTCTCNSGGVNCTMMACGP